MNNNLTLLQVLELEDQLEQNFDKFNNSTRMEPNLRGVNVKNFKAQQEKRLGWFKNKLGGP